MRVPVAGFLFVYLFVITGCGSFTGGIQDESIASAAHFSTPIPAEYFGATSAINIGGRPWPDAPMPIFRDFDSSWWRLEPAKGNWTFSMLDEDVRLAHEHGSQLELIFTTTPTWASARSSEPSPEPWLPPGERAEPANIQDWVTYVQTVATRYKGLVHNYECWNEPEIPTSYTGTVDQMIALCQVAYSTLKAIDPTIIFTSPSFGEFSGASFMDKYLSSGGADTFDVLSFHYYANFKSPESLISVIAKVRLLLSEHGLGGIPMWLTETGYYIESGPDAKDPYEAFPPNRNVLDSSLSQEYVARTFLIGQVEGVARVLWFCWGDNDFALVDDNGHTDKPATDAYRRIVQWLSGSSITSASHDANGTWTLAIKDPSGATAHIVWNEQERSIVTSDPERWSASSAEDIAGNQYSTSSGKVTISGMPMLLR